MAIRNYVLNPSSIRSFVCYQIFERDILKMSEPILMQIGTIGPRDKGRKRSTLGSGG